MVVCGLGKSLDTLAFRYHKAFLFVVAACACIPRLLPSEYRSPLVSVLLRMLIELPHSEYTKRITLVLIEQRTGARCAPLASCIANLDCELHTNDAGSRQLAAARDIQHPSLCC